MKVSVIIPVYNAEKFLRVCLESLLIQTMTDFEIICVDDCSTDSSRAIVRSYVPKFGGQLKIISLPKNNGAPAIPRNIGLENACGKYVYFMDNDDFIVDDALEIFCTFAEEYQADVVYTEKGFLCDGELVPENLVERIWNPPNFSHEVPTLETDDLGERVKKFVNLAFGVTPWTKFVRRDLLIEHKIFFPPVKISEDILWTFKVICSAKKILRVQTPLYVWCSPENSWSRAIRSPKDEINFWLDPVIKGFDYVEDFTKTHDFFKKNPAYRFAVLKFFETWNYQKLKIALKNFDPTELYEIFLREFTAAGNTQPALTAYLFVMINLYRNELGK